MLPFGPVLDFTVLDPGPVPDPWALLDVPDTAWNPYGEIAGEGAMTPEDALQALNRASDAGRPVRLNQDAPGDVRAAFDALVEQGLASRQEAGGCTEPWGGIIPGTLYFRVAWPEGGFYDADPWDESAFGQQPTTITSALAASILDDPRISKELAEWKAGCKTQAAEGARMVLTDYAPWIVLGAIGLVALNGFVVWAALVQTGVTAVKRALPASEPLPKKRGFFRRAA